MIATQHTQSLTDFRQKSTETLERLKESGQAEILTVNGVARAVLLSPEVYDALAREAELTRDVAVMRRALEELRRGESQELSAVSAEFRAELLALKNRSRRKSRK